MAPLIRIWSDYICPFCYVATERAAWLEREYGAEIEWLPFDLHPEYPPEGIAIEDLERQYGRELRSGQARMFDEAGLPHTTRTRLPRSHAALNVAELARERGVHTELHKRLMTAFWAEDRDISDPEVLAEEASAFGLDRDEVRDVAKTLPYEDKIRASTTAVQEMGGGGVPAFVVADRVMIPGAQPHDLFEKVMERLELPPRAPE
jgi:predicted DsbA family dithiol-disulfide isomerase